MTGRPRSILIDTSVWLDNYLGDHIGSDASRQLLSYALEDGISLLFAPTSATDVYRLITADLKQTERKEHGALDPAAASAIDEVAWSCVSNMSEVATAIGVDMSDLWMAGKLKGVHSNFEDDLVLAAAKRAKADYLVTWDTQLRRDSIVPALDPQSMLNLLQSFKRET